MERIGAMGVFVSAIDAGSLSGAARIAGVSVSSISRNISILEKRIGARLVVRTTRALALTDAGRLYYEKAKRILLEIDDLEAGVTAEGDLFAGRILVTGPALFGRVFLLPLLARFAVRHQQLVMEVNLLNRRVDPIQEGIDLSIIIGPVPSSNLIVRKLGSLRWVVCAAPSYLAKRGMPLSLRDLKKHDCLVYSPHGAIAKWEMQEHGKLDWVDVHVKMRSNTLDGVVAAAVEGAGLVCAPAWSLKNHIDSGRLEIVLDEYSPSYPINVILTHNRLLSGRVRALADFLAEQLQGVDFDGAPPFDTSKLG